MLQISTTNLISNPKLFACHKLLFISALKRKTIITVSIFIKHNVSIPDTQSVAYCSIIMYDIQMQIYSFIFIYKL